MSPLQFSCRNQSSILEDDATVPCLKELMLCAGRSEAVPESLDPRSEMMEFKATDVKMKQCPRFSPADKEHSRWEGTIDSSLVFLLCVLCFQVCTYLNSINGAIDGKRERR